MDVVYCCTLSLRARAKPNAIPSNPHKYEFFTYSSYGVAGRVWTYVHFVPSARHCGLTRP